MKKRIILYFSIGTLFLFSCNDKNELLTNYDYKSESQGFLKIISPYFYWETYTYYDPLYNKYFTRGNPSYSFDFSGYNFSFNYSRSMSGGGYYYNSIQIYVNGTYKANISWTNSDYEFNPRTILSSIISQGSETLRFSFYIHEFYIPMQAYSEPYSVRVSISDGR